jgi:hypothetical protein
MLYPEDINNLRLSEEYLQFKIGQLATAKEANKGLLAWLIQLHGQNKQELSRLSGANPKTLTQLASLGLRSLVEFSQQRSAESQSSPKQFELPPNKAWGNHYDR